MPTDPSSIQIDLTPRFQRDLRNLIKRYLKNSDIQKGKSGGYRVIHSSSD